MGVSPKWIKRRKKEKMEKRKKERRPKVGNNNGQLRIANATLCGASKAAWANKPQVHLAAHWLPGSVQLQKDPSIWYIEYCQNPSRSWFDYMYDPPATTSNSVLLLFKLAVTSNITHTNLIRPKKIWPKKNPNNIFF